LLITQLGTYPQVDWPGT